MGRKRKEVCPVAVQEENQPDHLIGDSETPNLEFVVPEEETAPEKTPTPQDADWGEYMLSQLKSYEIVDKRPTTSGLRRLVNTFVGRIVKSVPTILQWPNPQNYGAATVQYNIVVEEEDERGERLYVEFGDVADVTSKNCESLYAKHASATACTRAEGRALRKILGLPSYIITAEEQDNGDDEVISTAQIASIAFLCKKQNWNPAQLLGGLMRKYECELHEIPHRAAIDMINYMNECAGGKDKMDINANGYNPDWESQLKEVDNG